MIKKIIILAAGKGIRLKPITNDIPKCLTPVGEKTILEYQIDIAKKCGVEEIIVIGGFKIEKIKFSNITIIENKKFDSTNMVESLNCAKDYLNSGFILSYGDIIYCESVLKQMMIPTEIIAVAADMGWKSYWQERFDDPLSDAETFKFGEKDEILEIGKKPKNYSEVESQYIGLLSFSSKGAEILKNWLSFHFIDKNIYMTDMINNMIEMGFKIQAKKINRDWLEIDNLKDLDIARDKIFYDKMGTLKIKK